jgi:hypothetical protein
MARNLTDACDGFLRSPLRYLLLDHDTKFTAHFQTILKSAVLKLVLLPPRSPNCNAYIERFFRSLKDKALSRLILFGESALTRATKEFLSHYHRDRAHQGLRKPIERSGKSSAASEWADCSSITIGERPVCAAGSFPKRPSIV